MKTKDKIKKKLRDKHKKKNSDYKPVFTDGEHKLMQNYGVGDLIDEIGVNRVMLVRTLDKMNEVKDQLSFRDHLDALRAVAYTTGRICILLDSRERLHKPYEDVEKQYREFLEQVENVIDEVGPKIYGEKKWDHMQWNSFRNIMGMPDLPFNEESETDEHDDSIEDEFGETNGNESIE